MKTGTHQTLHERVCELVRIHGGVYDGRIRHLPAAIRRTQRDGQLRQTVRDAIRRHEYESTAHLDRDYRPGIGSGRSAHWLDISFATYAQTARAAHRTLGLRDEDCRIVARATIRIDYPHHQPWSPDGVVLPPQYTDWPDWYAREVI